MNCDDFNDWLQEQLDQRHNFVVSKSAGKHLRQCPVCRQQLDAWQQIASILPAEHVLQTIDASQFQQRRLHYGWVAAASAAAICLMIFGASLLLSNVGENKTRSLAKIEINRTSEYNDLSSASIDASRWWDTVRQRDWIGQTMPTVKSMRDGVAPLGRSLVQAVSLLTYSGGDQTS